jgi:hypothetical protein
MKSHFIIGRACSDYMEELGRISAMPAVKLTLNEDYFYSWQVIPRHTDSTTRVVINDGVVELVDGLL